MPHYPADPTEEVPLIHRSRAWRLRIVYQGRDQVRTLEAGQSLILGTSELADLRLMDVTVSSRHCKLHATPEGLHLSDLKSKNGVYLGAGRVESALLGGGRSSFSIGRTTVVTEEHHVRSPEAHLGLLGTSDAIFRVRERIRDFASLRAPVLICGESGTGKDLVARALHSESGRPGDYCPLNVAALSEGLLDTELFGHEKGAFTGATEQRTGMFEAANEGTLFLDEIADMSGIGQAKLLRVVEDGQVRAVGSEVSRRVDVRLVSATCASLKDRIEKGSFRHDLFHRLSTLVIELPPLRRRSEDIPILARFFLDSTEKELGYKRLLPAALESLRKAPWPGNVRELFGVLYRAAALTPGEALGPGHLAGRVRPRTVRARLLPQQAVEFLDVHGSVSAAARAAGVPRTTFRSTLLRYSPCGK